MLKENRLIWLTQKQLDAQRKTAGLTPISTAKPTSVAANPTKVASAAASGNKLSSAVLTQTDRMSAAESNANLQEINRANQLSTNTGTVKSYIDPKTGIDTRYINPTTGLDSRTVSQYGTKDVQTGVDNQGNPIYETQTDFSVYNPEYNKKYDGTLNSFDTVGVQYQNTGSGTNAALGLAERGSQDAGYTSSYAVPKLGVIDTKALRELMDTGMSQSDALARLQANRPNVQQAFNEVGTNRTPDKTLAEKRAEELAGIKGYRTVTKYDANGNPYSFNEIDLQKTEELKSEAQKRWAIEDATTSRNRSNEQVALAGRNAEGDMTNSFDVVSPSAKTPLTFGEQPQTKAQIDQNAIEFARSQGMSDEEIQQRIENGTLPPAPLGQTTSEPSKTPNFGTQAPSGTATGESTSTTGKTHGGGTTGDSAPLPKAPAVNTELGALNAALASAFAGNPLGEVYKQSILQDYAAEQQKMENALASRDASITQAAVDNSDTQAFIEKWAGKATANTNVLTGLLKGINNDTNKYLNEQKANDLDRLAFDKQVQTQKLEKQKAQDILTSSISLALSGGAFSGAGQNALAETERDWDVSIQNLAKEYSFKAADVGTFYTQKYVDAKNQLSLDLYNSSTALDAKLEGYANQGFASIKARQNAETTARNNYRTEVNGILTDHSNNLKGYIKDIGAEITKVKETKMVQESLGWSQLKQAVDVYGTNVPQAMIDSIKTKLPGVDIAAVVKTPTLEQLKKLKGTGSGTGGSSFALGLPSSQEALTASLFANVTPQNLSEVVDRVVREFGGTGAEREVARGKYYNRIQKGEPIASIIESLKNDFWSASKGAPRTAHDGRTEAQASAESLQSFVDSYGISGADDGPLGPIDSRKEGLASWFGMSSEEYNNLATNVGNIRARIIKENYGAAVTPQELAIAQSYIPSMQDKGAQFITKLQNLKAYNAYLDAKLFADAAGIPAPSAPKPVTLSGDKVAGPSKYSADDITSALSE